MKRILTLLIISLVMTTSVLNAQLSSSVEKDKVLKELALSSFETVEFKGGGIIYLHYSPKSKAEVKGVGSCGEQVNIEVSSGILKISPKGNYSENCKLEIHVYTPSISKIKQNGGGRIVMEDGFSPVDIFKCSLDGGGNIEMTALEVNSLLASIDGGGVISAQVTKKLHGKIRGGGLILYQGDPLVESNISGGGAIKQK